MKKLILIIASTIAVLSCTDKDVRTARELLSRVAPAYSGSIVFQKLESDTDVYELESKGSGVVIRGNNANSMAVGLNRYLTEWCKSNVSWYDFNPVIVPEKAPVIASPVRAEANVKDRFFLNYCTFGYTMPWWGWEQWERFIDWMALNGVNMPLAITGQEAVWEKVWKKHGLSEDQIRAFFVGPAHLPWQRMCNLDRWEGPLPQEWIDSQAKLQKKILKRERAFSMRPVLPAFAGHIPAELADVYPGIDTSRVSFWGGFADEYRCTFLSPMDPLYEEIQKDFLKEQTRLYGTDHIYGVDPFNEIDSPSWDPGTQAAYSKHIFDSICAVDDAAVWLQMAWLFYADQQHWTPENIKAYLTAVPQGRMILLDYYCEFMQLWQSTEAFYGQPYIWCYLGNFGGNTMIEGDFKDISVKLARTAAEGGSNFSGIGSTLEGFGVNETIYQFLLSKAWNTGVGDEEWLDNMADSRFGAESETFRAAWRILYDDIYNSTSRTGRATLTNSHPCFDGHWHWTTQYDITYSNERLKEALNLMKKETSTRDGYLFDVVNLERQYLGNRFAQARDAFTEAYRSRNMTALDAAAEEMEALLDSIDTVLSSREEFSLDRWISDARRFGDTPEQKDYYEKNARTLITIWGDSYTLTDYASRNLSGLTSTYYKQRWMMFINAAKESLAGNTDFDTAAFDAGIRAFEEAWTERVIASE